MRRIGLRAIRLLPIMIVMVLGQLKSSKANAWWMWSPGDTVENSTQSMIGSGYHPDQPIDFPHNIHADKLKMDCQYCHSAARRSQSAGVPPLNTCMGCHKIVASDKESIKYITEKFKKNEPVEWTKVHDMPDFVRFSHKPHVLAGFTCQECHGPMQEKVTAATHAPMQMGWCIGCHKDNLDKGAKISCNTCHY